MKINKLLESHPPSTVFTSKWMQKRGYSLPLQKRYRDSEWFRSIGQGAMVRYHDKVSYEGAVYALQQDLGLNVHLGGRTSLALQGKAHYVDLGKPRVTLIGNISVQLPRWFLNYEWNATIDYFSTAFLPYNLDLGFTQVTLDLIPLRISSPARAMMECLHLAPKNQDLVECYELMESLNNLDPSLVQELLEQCNSIKVKRLFMFLAEKAEHAWAQEINKEKIDFGSGTQKVAKGVYIPLYKITVPEELK